MQAAAAAFSEQLDKQRALLTPNQLKKQRKKRARLLQQAAAAMADGGGSDDPAADKRMWQEADDEPETSASAHLPAHHQALCCQLAAADAADSKTCHKRKRQCQPEQLIKKPFLPGPLRRLQQRGPSSRPTSSMQSSDMSDVMKALQHHSQLGEASNSVQQQPQQDDSVQQPDLAAGLHAAGVCASPSCIAGTASRDGRSAGAAAGADGGSKAGAGAATAAAATAAPAAVAVAAAKGPCRSDLSGQLMLINQQLASNNSSSGHHRPPPHHQPRPPSNPSCQPPAGPGAPAAQQHLSRKQQRPDCRYGNYHHYYGYRLGPAGFEDPRLKVLDPAWFRGGDVLDVGCNEGLLTLALAVGCGCRSMTGVDIDAVLVSKACKNLSRSRSELTQQFRAAVAARDTHATSMRSPPPPPPPSAAAGEAAPASPAVEAGAAAQAAAGSDAAASQADSGTSCMTPLSIIEVSGAMIGSSAPSNSSSSGSAATSLSAPKRPAGRTSTLQEQPQQLAWQQQRHLQAQVVKLDRELRALSRVSFTVGDWLQLTCPSDKYEAVTCFSVTKWVHLNWGDDGLMKLFHKLFRCLAPGGVLVLEPQPFKSYKNAAHKPGVTEAPFHKLDQLKLRPEGFCDFLIQRVGFELLHQLSAVSEATGKDAVPVQGFDRPILVLRKPAAGTAAVAGGGGGG